jgi:hypothetical protein
VTRRRHVDGRGGRERRKLRRDARCEEETEGDGDESETRVTRHKPWED